MHREDLVVDLRPDEGRARRRQLRPDQHGEDAADGEVDTRRDHEADAEIAVIDVGENAFPAALPPPDRIEFGVELERAHGRSPPASFAQAASSWARTLKFMTLWPVPQNSAQTPP